jgi:hypothetical protein
LPGGSGRLGIAVSFINIIFLDFDGVLVTTASAFRRRDAREVADRDAVEALNYLLGETGARLVVISQWRLDYSEEELRGLLEAWGVQAEMLGVTPSAETRSEEIQMWLDEYRGDSPIGSFVILDDMTDMGHLAHRLVNTEFETGLTIGHAREALGLMKAAGQKPGVRA